MHLPSPLWGLSYANGALQGSYTRARLVTVAAVAGTVNGYSGSIIRGWSGCGGERSELTSFARQWCCHGVVGADTAIRPYWRSWYWVSAIIGG